MFACEQEDVAPDFLCLAKGLTAGYLPMAATLTHGCIWDAFLGTSAAGRAFYHGHTYGGNPLAAAVGLASLDIFEDDRVMERLPTTIARLAAHAEHFTSLDGVGSVRQCGLVLGIDLVADKATGMRHPRGEQRGRRACRAARNHGVILRPLGDVVVIVPPLSISDADLELLVAAAEAGIHAATHTTALI
jgi:adenosylmethionine-8-amino-7-oxononanoate aminotransferase